mmetsp:Transcript_22874/g.51559  ORF Transcript_22874/g.51559 Transcript_22874/m.51559 type:complete len:122 (+) Transcript_22874:1689-2054(+)
MPINFEDHILHCTALFLKLLSSKFFVFLYIGLPPLVPSSLSFSFTSPRLVFSYPSLSSSHSLPDNRLLQTYLTQLTSHSLSSTPDVFYFSPFPLLASNCIPSSPLVAMFSFLVGPHFLRCK